MSLLRVLQASRQSFSSAEQSIWHVSDLFGFVDAGKPEDWNAVQFERQSVKALLNAEEAASRPWERQADKSLWQCPIQACAAALQPSLQLRSRDLQLKNPSMQCALTSAQPSAQTPAVAGDEEQPSLQV